MDWKERVFDRDGYKCVYCGRDGRADFWVYVLLQVDHVVPKSKGGSEDDESNLVTACMVCNKMKGAQVWESIEHGRKEIKKYYEAIRAHWERNVRVSQNESPK